MGHQAADVVLLPDDQLEPAAAVMARAFRDYPLLVSVFPDPTERLQTVQAGIAWAVRHGRMFGEVAGIGVPLVGMSLLFPPDDDPFSSERIAQSGYDKIAEQLSAATWERLTTAPQQFYGEAEFTRTVTDPHWHLDAIAVDPAHQGQGIGSALLDAVHARTAADGRPVGLVTHDARTIPLYLRHEYQLVLEGIEPTSRVRHWGFLRYPPP